MSEFEYLNSLNDGQYEAATTIEGPVRILAGAGSGKTHTLIHRVAYMVDKGIPPEQILLLTFTNNAAKNMVDRAATMANSKCKNITACTYHSFCASLLRRYGKNINLDENFTIITPAEVADAIKLVKSQDPRFDDIKELPVPKKIGEIYSKSVNMMLNLETTVKRYYKKYENVIADMQQIIMKYMDYKEEKNLVDYDDLLVKTVELLEDEALRDHISDAYRYVMVDEYQDSNTLQEKIVFMIAGKYKNLAIVGDDYQSIYAFRGSDINNILEFPERFSKDCRTVMVNVNYRSTQEVLDVANSMMDHFAKFGCKKTMISDDKHGEKPVLCIPGTAEEEAALIVKYIEAARKNKKSLEDIAILERNSMSSFRLEAMLDKNCIPYRKLGGLKFMELVCVLDILAFMRAITNHKDELAFYRILDTLPFIGEKYAHYVVDVLMMNGVSVSAISQYANKPFYTILCAMIDLVNKVPNETDISKQFDMIYSFYIDARQAKITNMRANNDKKKEAQEKLEHDMQSLSALRDIVVTYNRIVEFLDDLMLDANMKQEEKGEMVTISTIHSAKGMEWNTVFMLDCVDGVFPKTTKRMLSYSRSDPLVKKEYYEELRCFYVAITRAKSHLYIMAPEELIVFGKVVCDGPSHYLDHSQQYLNIVDGYAMSNALPEKRLFFEAYPHPETDSCTLKNILNATERDNMLSNINDGKCCVCGKNIYSVYPLTFWDYDDTAHTQALLKVGGACEDCYVTAHAMELFPNGVESGVFAHYGHVNHCDITEAEKDYTDAVKLQAERSKYKWKKSINPEILRKLTRTPKSKNISGAGGGFRTYIDVPYEEKDDAKRLGARWDPKEKSWYVPENVRLEKFEQWM